MIRFLLPAALLLSTGCTKLFFYPSGKLYYHPEDLGAKYDTVRFRAPGGPLLTGMFFPAVGGEAEGTVVHFHGNAQNMTTHFVASYWLKDHGFNVFVFDYRGYGASEGKKPSVREALADCETALRYVRSRPDVDPDKIAAFGQSLGGSLAVTTIARMSDAGVRALIIEGSFSSYSSIARDKIKRIFFLRPLRWPLSLLFFTTRYHPTRHMKRLPEMPILFVHGDKDDIVPIEEGKKLFALAREPKEFWTVPGGGHTEAFTRYGATYRPKLAAYLRSAFSPDATEAP